MSTILENNEDKKSFWAEYKIIIVIMAVLAVIIVAIVAFVLKEDEVLPDPDFVSQYAPVEEGATCAEIVVKGFGSIKIQLFKSKAPLACENFITHSKEGYYDGVTFHRVIDDFMIQGGDPKGDGTGGESIWGKDFEDEITKDLVPMRGALCMANAGANTNGSQFFIVQRDQYDIQYVIDMRNKDVDFELVEHFKEVGGAGHLYGAHTVFGQVYEGMDVVDKIAAVSCDSNDMPDEEIVIETIKIYQYKD